MAVAGVGDQEVVGVGVGGWGQAVQDGVVDYAAGGVADQGVAGFAGGEGGCGCGQGVVEEGGGLGAGDVEAAHVGYIE